MAIGLVGTSFPAFEPAVRQLVLTHINIPNERLLLAIYYRPNRPTDDIFLFEVIENFGANSIDSGQELLEVTYNSSPAFPMDSGQELHLILTSPEEFRTAVAGRWRHIIELQEAIRGGEFICLHNSGIGAMIGV